MEPRRRAQRHQRARAPRRGALLTLAIGSTLAWMLALGGSALAQGVQLVPFGGQSLRQPVPRRRRRRATPTRVFVVEAAGHDPAGQVGGHPADPVPGHQRRGDGRRRGRRRCECGHVLDGVRARLRLQRALLRLLHARRSSPGLALPADRGVPPLGLEPRRRRPGQRQDRARHPAPRTPSTTTAASSSSAPTACSTSGSATAAPRPTRRPLDRLLGQAAADRPRRSRARASTRSRPTTRYDGPGGDAGRDLRLGLRNP